MPVALRVRRSIADIQADYDAGNKTELENLVRAFKGISELPPTDPNSFFVIGGYHGEPFSGPGATDPMWWGGYCQHATVLFPTWHRAYMKRIEDALRSIPGCDDVTLPFWDETSSDSATNGIPSCLTDEFFELDGQQIANPLRSFTLPVAITDAVPQDQSLYSKPAGYQTVRYPLSGLVGTAAWEQETAAHNAMFPTTAQQNALLDKNIVSWLTTNITFPQDSGPPVTMGLIRNRFAKCMDAPNYTLFSNTTSMGAWNSVKTNPRVEALEDAHNLMHLAVGGFDVPGPGGFNASQIRGANGDMGENNTAALDPIFFFHHCFIDYAFWTWQRRHGQTQGIDIDPGDPGAKYDPPNSLPPDGGDPSATLSLDTPLDPFTNPDGSVVVSRDLIDVEGQLGYTFGPGSLDRFATPPSTEALAALKATPVHRRAHVSQINRSRIRGSFLIATWSDDGTDRLLDVTPVLSRWQVEGCANCQTKLGVTADVDLPEEIGAVRVELHTRDGVIGNGPSAASTGALPEAMTEPLQEVPFTVEIR